MRGWQQASWLIVLLWPCLTQAATVPNAGFEQKNVDGAEMPADWTADQWGAVAATFTWTTTGHVGRGARVQVTATGSEGDAKWYGTDFATDPGAGKYVVADWYHSDVETELILNAIAADGTDSYVSVATLPPAATWTLAEGTVVVPAGTQRLRVLHVIRAVGTLDIDDVTCKGVDGTTVQPGKYKATVSFTFDDGWLSAYNMLIPRLDQKGWPATHFIITTYPDKPGYQSDYILSAQVKSLIARGHEVCSHTLTHRDLATLTQPEWTSELHDPIATLQSWGAKAAGFAAPYGSYTPAITTYAATQYAYLRTLHPDVNVPPYDLQALNGHVITNTSDLAELEELLTRAEQVDGGWVILVFHRAGPVLPPDMPGVEAYVRPDDFQTMLDLIEKHGAKVETVGQHLAVFTPTKLPDDPTLVVGDKALDPPDVATKATLTTTDTATTPDAGCQSAPMPTGLGLWPLMGALMCLFWKRKS